jgi:hypothetical protein
MSQTLGRLTSGRSDRRWLDSATAGGVELLEEHLAEFPATVQGLPALRDWLDAPGVKQVAMEAHRRVRPPNRGRATACSWTRPARPLRPRASAN